MNSTNNLTELYQGKLGIRRNVNVWLMRHGNAPKAPSGNDADRRLSYRGRRQCEAQRDILSIDFDKIFCSPRERVRESLCVTLGAGRGITQVDELFDPVGDDGALINKAFDILGYVPLYEYFRNEKVAAALDRWADRALRKLQASAWGMVTTMGEPFNILIGGSAIYTPLLGYYLSGDERVRRACFFMNMQECDIVRVGDSEDQKNPIDYFLCPSIREEEPPD